MISSFIRFFAQDIAFGLACAAVSVVLAVVGLWSVGITLGDDPALLLALSSKAAATPQ